MSSIDQLIGGNTRNPKSLMDTYHQVGNKMKSLWMGAQDSARDLGNMTSTAYSPASQDPRQQLQIRDQMNARQRPPIPEGGEKARMKIDRNSVDSNHLMQSEDKAWTPLLIKQGNNPVDKNLNDLSQIHARILMRSLQDSNGVDSTKDLLKGYLDKGMSGLGDKATFGDTYKLQQSLRPHIHSIATKVENGELPKDTLNRITKFHTTLNDSLSHSVASEGPEMQQQLDNARKSSTGLDHIFKVKR